MSPLWIAVRGDRLSAANVGAKAGGNVTASRQKIFAPDNFSNLE
jgi:hypothetical protein